MAQYGDQKYEREGRQTDEYDNSVPKTDAYGNPLHSATEETNGEYGVTGHQGLGHATGATESYQNQPSATPFSGSDIGTGTGATTDLESPVTSNLVPPLLPAPARARTLALKTGTGYDQHSEEGHEKLLGGHSTDDHQKVSTTKADGFAGGYGEGGETHEKKGVTEKIREKLPGGQNKDGHQKVSTTTPDGIDSGYVEGGDTYEKKGVTEKIKETLPGGHKTDEHQRVSSTTGGVGGGGYGEGGETHEKKGVMEKIKEKLPGHH
ncbi:unnamed protein product [Lactuca virosa]|uniref:Dehydrin n=1 Tax=Lactuca virosa TaxID=75947 RepID=A0AAU9LGK1_9ASTR|nr:unnamed protein product [Lactuca virosa]